jgi:hypothetical protein
MASLRAFDNIQGTPAPKAITLRAIVQAHGHDIRIDESTDKVATVSVRRKGSSEWQTCTWTIERAQQAGFFAKNPNWKSNPTAMLIARATAEMCRWVASDAIMGMPYAAEEIADRTGAQAVPATSRVTAAEIVGKAVDHARPKLTVDDALQAIADAQSITDLEGVRHALQEAGIRDERVVAAWRDRGYELGGDAA